MSEHTEYELLELARAGDDDAFEQLQMALERPVRRFIRRLIGRSDVEDDITQNAFFALYKNLARLDEGAKLRPFLFRVVRNQCYDELRRQGRYDVVSLDDDVSGYSDDGDGSWSVAVASDAPQPDEATYWMMVFSEVQEASSSYRSYSGKRCCCTRKRTSLTRKLPTRWLSTSAR